MIRTNPLFLSGRLFAISKRSFGPIFLGRDALEAASRRTKIRLRSFFRRRKNLSFFPKFFGKIFQLFGFGFGRRNFSPCNQLSCQYLEQSFSLFFFRPNFLPFLRCFIMRVLSFERQAQIADGFLISLIPFSPIPSRFISSSSARATDREWF